MTVQPGFLGWLQRENEAMLHAASAADLLWQRRISVYPNKSAAYMLLGRHFGKPAAHVEGNFLSCATCLTNSHSRLGVHVLLFK
jgi:hypothetical protein